MQSAGTEPELARRAPDAPGAAAGPGWALQALHMAQAVLGTVMESQQALQTLLSPWDPYDSAVGITVVQQHSGTVAIAVVQ